MAYIYPEPAHTFSEYLLVPGYTSEENIPENVSLQTPLAKFRRGEQSRLTLNIPMASAIMQAVSGPRLAVALATEGGMSFICGNQTPEDEAAMIREVKAYKAGFVRSDSNLSPEMTLADVLELKEKTGHSTMPVTVDGTPNSRLVGIVTSRDYRVSRMDPSTKVSEFMTPREKLICGPANCTLSEANDIIWDNKLNSLPIVDDEGRLVYLVFRKDYDSHKANPNELLDIHKRFIVGAGINSRDYAERVPVLLEAGADALCIDSSEGYSVWQKRTLDWIRNNYGDEVIVGAGNVISAEGFRFPRRGGRRLRQGGRRRRAPSASPASRRASAAARPPRSSRCAARRDKYFEETGVYVPVCSDGGIVHDYHVTLALAMGADFVMLGRYFARFDESPSRRVIVNGSYMKEYWGEGSARARNWQRYDLGGKKTSMSFVEGVDSYVPYAGSLKDGVGRHARQGALHHVQLRRAYHPRAAEERQAHPGLRDLAG